MNEHPTHGNLGDRRDQGGHDEALPPFPPEQDWLSQPLPPELADVDLGAFAQRTLDALQNERQLDHDLAALDRELPRIVLAAHEVPEPAPDFVPSVLAALHRDRRARWQQLLARHIAPEPSPEFVARTLSALRSTGLAAAGLAAAGQHPASDAALDAGTDGEGTQAVATLAPRSLADRRRSPSPPLWRHRWPWLAAAAAVAWLALALQRGDGGRPLEARLAEFAPALEAHAAASSPLAFVLANHERQRGPTPFDANGADGVWLQLAGGR